MNTKFNDLLGDIIHLASGAMLAEDEQVKRQAMGDILNGIISVVPWDGAPLVGESQHRGTEAQRIDELTAALDKIEARLRVFNKSNLYPEQVKWLDETQQIALDATVPVERAARGSAPTDGRACRPATAADPQGFAKFMTVAPGVTLVRFHGKDEIRLVARRVGSSGNPNTIFEIVIDKALKHATAFRDGRILFELQGVTVGYSKVEAMAVSSLKRWFRDQRKHNAQRRRKRKARLGILTPEQELARTVAEQKEGL